ncbi:MAG: outer membrane protein transport protein [Bacteroidia bacterium]|nr:outer membrane protein transport protein [Bacteroidia bacterium]
MKKILLSAFCVFSAVTFSNAQIDNLTNLSPEWVRTGARNATINSPDAVVYNPAGVSKLEEGWHIGLGNQSFFRKPSHRYNLGFGEVKNEQDGNDMFVPNLYAAYRKGKISGFGGVYIAGGGATANYPNGTINTELISMMSLMAAEGAYEAYHKQYFKANSYYLTSLLGFSYSLSENLSMSASVRMLSAKNKIEAGTTLTMSPLELPDLPIAVDAESKASGMGVMIGLNHMINEKTNIMIRYESKVKLDFKNKTEKDDAGLFPDGEKARRDFPAVLATGIGSNLSDKIRVSIEYSFYFQKNADWGTTYTENGEVSLSKLAGDVSVFGLAAEYKTSEKFLISAGTMYTVNHYSDKAGYYTTAGAFETAPGTNLSLNAGFCYSINAQVKVNLGAAKIFWKKDEQLLIKNLLPAEVPAVINNDMFAVGAGINFSF